MGNIASPTLTLSPVARWKQAHRALLSLAEVHAMFVGAAQLLSDPAQLATEQRLAEFAHHAQKMTALAETEINKAIQACKRY